jgi:hypothetical protein
MSTSTRSESAIGGIYSGHAGKSAEATSARPRARRWPSNVKQVAKSESDHCFWETPKVIFRGEVLEARNSMSRSPVSAKTSNTSPSNSRRARQSSDHRQPAAAQRNLKLGVLRADMTEKVLEKLGSTESTTLALTRETDGKIRVASLLWEAPR